MTIEKKYCFTPVKENKNYRVAKNYKIKPRSKVENLVLKFVEKNKIYAIYGKDTEGIFEVKFVVKEED